MAHVLIVTLGPIQDFIEAARRTRDLWFGSWLLSELSKATAKALAAECGIESLVFPGISKLSDLEPASSSLVANKIVIRVPEGKDAAQVAERGKEALKERLRVLREEAFEKIDSEYFERLTAVAQVEDFIELAWVSAPERGEDGYDEARKRAEALLAARKNTRLWGKVTWGAEVPKSSIDGERESVLHEDLFKSVLNGTLSPEQVRQRYGVGKTERLCGVGLLKRHGTRQGWHYEHRFLSTGHLAAWPIHARTKELEDPDLRTAWEEYLAVLEKGGVDLREQEIVQGEGWRHDKVFGKYDGSLLFEGRLTDLFEEVAEPKRHEGLREARQALAVFLKKLGVPTPLPYYAILVADGDSMGKAIERQKTFKEHQDLSRALDGFARSVRTTVERDHGGELVYAGGDDVLAFVPLHKAIDCARQLSKAFLSALSGFPADGDKTPTLSAGLGISHFMDPLRGALRLARKAEKLAKVKRNSLAVIVDKRSGPPVEAVGVWGTLDQRLDDYTDLHRADYVPDGAAYELRELARLLEGAKGPEREPLENLVKAEAKRILGRKQPAHGAQSNIDPEIFKRITEEFETTPVAEVADQLIVARLLAQAKDEAGVPLKREGDQP